MKAELETCSSYLAEIDTKLSEVLHSSETTLEQKGKLIELLSFVQQARRVLADMKD